ncbi:MAG: hypothetical protein C0404_13150 [Verrucomicrobia bacterium]|nr:hypothetical protein [Verrucomicrobiota bacterium]
MLSDDVRTRVLEVAQKQHTTLQKYLTMALLEKLASQPDPVLEKRARRGRRKDFDAFMAQVPDVPPDDYDRKA